MLFRSVIISNFFFSLFSLSSYVILLRRSYYLWECVAIHLLKKHTKKIEIDIHSDPRMSIYKLIDFYVL